MKVYVCLFTCASSRAIHLDYVTDLSTEKFLMCFRRFCARKSKPSVMVSDNASYFECASVELRKLFQHPAMAAHMADNRIEWRSIPKRAPWFGAFWERLIGLTKNSLKKVLGRACVSDSELSYH